MDENFPRYDEHNNIDSNGVKTPRRKCPPKTYTDVYCDPVAENKKS